MLRPEQLETIRATAEWMLGLMSLRLDVTVHAVAGRIQINVTGEDRPYLITDRGETILSLQYFLSRFIRQRMPELEECRVFVDSDGYLLRCEQNVRRMAERAMQQARRDHRGIKLPPLNPNDRRIVHTEVSRYGNFDSVSEGDGFLKQVVVRRKHRR